MSTQELTRWVIYDPETLESLGQADDFDDALVIAEARIVLGEREHITISRIGDPEDRYSSVLVHTEGEPSEVIVIKDPPDPEAAT